VSKRLHFLFCGGSSDAGLPGVRWPFGFPGRKYEVKWTRGILNASLARITKMPMDEDEEFVRENAYRV
jgi:hypothetical protein